MRARRFIEKTLMIVGAISIVLGIAGAVIGVGMLRRGFGAREAPSSAEAFVARGLRRLSTPDRVKALVNPVKVTPEVLADARAHWADHCAGCHGNDGRGQTDLGKNLYPRAPDMTGGFSQELTDGELYHAIQDGIRLTGMPAWGDANDEADEQTWALVSFIRHLPKLTPEELLEMESLNPRSVHEQTEEAAEDEFLNAPADETEQPAGMEKTE